MELGDLLVVLQLSFWKHDIQKDEIANLSLGQQIYLS